jgi:hypothetical protein
MTLLSMGSTLYLVCHEHKHIINSTIVRIVKDDGAQALKHVGYAHQICVYNRYFAFSWY